MKEKQTVTTMQGRELFDATSFEIKRGFVKNPISPHVPERTVVSQLEIKRKRRKRNYKRGALLRKIKRQGVLYDIPTQTIFDSKQIKGNKSVTTLVKEYGFIISIHKQGAYNLGI